MAPRLEQKQINIFSRNLAQTKTFNLLSIGQRGVGKTVFIVGSYAELQANHLTSHPQKLWFDCQNDQAQENIEKIISYIIQTNQYPPPTMKIVNFKFSLKQQSLWGKKTLCNFSWNDIPGEICNIHNLEFRNMVFNSHGCCVFIDAYALRYSDAYLQVLDDIFEQVMALTSLVYLNGLQYPLALILTKSDLLEPSSPDQQIITKKLQPLITHLNAVKTNYQIFKSSVPLIYNKDTATLGAKGAAVSLLWLVWQLNKVHNPGLALPLFTMLNRILPSNFNSQQKLPNSTMQSLFNANNQVQVKDYAVSSPNNNLLKSWKLLYLTLGSVSMLLLLLIGYQQFFQTDFNNNKAIENINALQQSGQFQQAVQLLEQIIQREPQNIELRLKLAQLYEVMGKAADAENVYDQILTKQKDHLKALIAKAVLRQVHGDTKSASALFKQAEQVAPNALKSQVRAVANNTLRPTKQQKNN